MSKRAPSPPPQIPGFEHVSLIGSGGFSDVFLYEQKRPRRRVAIKVLLHEWSNPAQRAAFDGEADLMARLSTHPSIVTIYEADVAPDGRPYLAMEYCSRQSLGTRYRTERLGLAESLRVIVQIAGAVETAHRAGILHRDIKPANILGTDYGHPVLTDFGISSTVDDVARAEGLSIPWSPPESFEDPPRASVATDVWALAATLYSFLAGRSPFEVPGGANGSAELVQRICAQPLAPTGRSDVPASLELVLSTAMAKNPTGRYPSVLELARALQQVQIELGHGVTPIDLLGDTGVVQDEVVAADDEYGTRLRGVLSIDPSGRTPAGGGRPAPGPAAPAAQAPVWPGSTPQAPRPAARPTPPVFDAAPAPVPAAVRQDTARVAVVDPTPQFAASTPLALVPTPGALPVPVEDTVLRPEPGAPPAPGAAPSAPPASSGRGLLALVGGLVALVLVLAVVGFVTLRPHHRTPGVDPVVPAVDGDDGLGGDGGSHDNLSDLVPPVQNLEGFLDGKTATFFWDAPDDAADGDTYGWRVLDVLHPDTPFTETTSLDVDVPVKDGRACIEVVVLRASKASAEPQRACAPDDSDDTDLGSADDSSDDSDDGW